MTNPVSITINIFGSGQEEEEVHPQQPDAPAPAGRIYNYTPDVPDVRDHYLFGTHRALPGALPQIVDMRPLMTPVEDQGQLGSCTANAAVGAVEYLDNRIDKTYKNYSRLFLYYNERKLEHTTLIDSGAYIRDAIKALNRYGVCTEETWPYDISKYAVRPSIGAYKEALKYIETSYMRVNQTEQEMMSALFLGYPIILGFSVYESFESDTVAQTGVVPMPGQGEKLLGGHAVLAVGYDQSKRQFICRNSWGSGWGLQGYFLIPFDYLTNGDLAEDMWCIEKVTNVSLHR